jgi:NTE family protein
MKSTLKTITKLIVVLIVLIMPISTIRAQGQEPVIGVFLTGGGALGYAHVGALLALEEAGISPEYVAGASMGALIGLFYTYGFSPKEIVSIIYESKVDKKVSLVAVTGAENKGLGFITHKKVKKILDKYILTNSFDSLKKNFTVLVSNLTDARTESYCTGGQLKEYVLASMSVPVLFEPIIINDKVYVDGGSLNHLPSQVIRDKVDILIGIEVMPKKVNVVIKNKMDIISSYVHSAAIINSQPGRDLCDYVVDINSIDKYSVADFNHFEEIYLNGYLTMKHFLEDHPDLVSRCHK